MLIFDRREISRKLFAVRKRRGYTQSEVAERAGLSDRTYADIERGNGNMKAETLLRICDALNITPNEILTKDDTFLTMKQEEMLTKLEKCTEYEKRTALELLSVYLKSLK